MSGKGSATLDEAKKIIEDKSLAEEVICNLNIYDVFLIYSI